VHITQKCEFSLTYIETHLQQQIFYQHAFHQHADTKYFVTESLYKSAILILHADDVVQRHGYSDHFVTICVCVCVCVGVYVSMTERKLLIAITWNLGQ